MAKIGKGLGILLGAAAFGGIAYAVTRHSAPMTGGTKTGILILTVTPPETVVKISGIVFTPGTYDNVNVGTYGWTATASGYTSQSGTVTIVEGQTTTLNIQLQQTGTTPPPTNTGRVTFIFDPVNLTMTLNGQVYTAGTYDLPAGNYALVASATGYVTYTDTLIIQDGEDSSITVSLVAAGPPVAQEYNIGDEFTWGGDTFQITAVDTVNYTYSFIRIYPPVSGTPATLTATWQWVQTYGTKVT